jgi:hypothetical protein
MPRQIRPTLRCLREDLGLPVPRVDAPLDEIAHPLLAKAAEHFADGQAGRERIREPPLCVGRGVLGVAQPRRAEQADPRDAMGVPPGDLGIVTISTPRRRAGGGEERRCAGHL